MSSKSKKTSAVAASAMDLTAEVQSVDVSTSASTKPVRHLLCVWHGVYYF
jgi:hypothetical protein